MWRASGRRDPCGFPTAEFRACSDGGVAAPGAQSVEASIHGGIAVTLLWFVIWLIANTIGDHEVLIVDPVNWWAGTLILAVALDLARQHAPRGK